MKSENPINRNIRVFAVSLASGDDSLTVCGLAKGFFALYRSWRKGEKLKRKDNIWREGRRAKKACAKVLLYEAVIISR